MMGRGQSPGALCLLLAASLLLDGCGAEQDSKTQPGLAAGARPTAEPAPSIAVDGGARTFVHDCSDGVRLTVRVEGGKAWLFLPSGTVSLPQARAASGAKYSDGTITYWSKGEQAMLERPGHGRVECNNNRRAAIWEDAKLRGADFRATGNEPGWYLEIGRSTGILLVTNYGADRYHFEQFEASSDAPSRQTTYVASKDGQPLTVVLEGSACMDSMSGEQFETAVTLTLGTTVLNGCGRALH